MGIKRGVKERKERKIGKRMGGGEQERKDEKRREVEEWIER